MKNKVVVQICDIEYNLITDEPEDYVKSLADEITAKIETAVYKNLRTSKTDAAMLTCLELCDKIYKLSIDNNNMSRQVMGYVEEIGELNKKLLAFERKKSPKSKESNEANATTEITKMSEAINDAAEDLVR